MLLQGRGRQPGKSLEVLGWANSHKCRGEQQRQTLPYTRWKARTDIKGCSWLPHTWCSMHEPAFKCMYICVSCIYACTCEICVRVCSVACVSRASVSTYVKAENNLGAPIGRLSPYFEKSLLLAWSFLIQLDWLDSKLQGSFCLYFPSMLGLQLLSTFDEAGIHAWKIVPCSTVPGQGWRDGLSSCIIHPDVLATRQDLGFRNRKSTAQISTRRVLRRTQAKESVHEEEVWAVNSVLSL